MKDKVFLCKKYFIVLFILFAAGCDENTNKPLSGYIEGQYTYIASGVPGTLFHLYVLRGQPVKKGDLLYQLDPQPDFAFMQAAEANVAQLVPELSFDKIQLHRQAQLYLHNAASQSDVDQAQTNYDSKAKQLESAQRALTQAQWALNQKAMHAPASGYVFDTFYRIGEKVAVNQPVLALLTPDNIRVLFYIPETKLSTLHLGQVIHFTCDGCQQSYTARINYISSEAEYTPPIIYSADTRYNLVYLVRADLPAAIAKNFHPGQPLDITLNE